MLITLAAGFFVLSVVILAHEFGHFVVAKKMGVFVRTFSIGFGRKLLARRVGETQYAVSVLPFGGYVRFAGELTGEEEPPEDGEIPDSDVPPERHFRNQPPVKKAAVIFAGPFMNYLLAVAVYAFVFRVLGVPVLPTTTVGEVEPGSPADSVGILAGDRVIAVDGEPVRDWWDLVRAVGEAPEEPHRLLLDRRGDSLVVTLTPREEGGRYRIGIQPFIPPRIGVVKYGGPAHRAGIRPGAVILAIDDTRVQSYSDIQRTVYRSAGRPLVFRWEWEGTIHQDTIVPEAKRIALDETGTKTRTVGQIGVTPYEVRRRMGLVASLGQGFHETHRMIRILVRVVRKLVTREVSLRTLGGPVMVTVMAGDMARWGFDSLLYLLAFFSVNLFIFNLLPLLPFDGGHLAILVFEGVARRKVSDRARAIAAQMGFALVILLMVYVLFLDLSRLMGGGGGF
jgi:regulator of sigma E protease